eukprot:c45357_g1_i1.p1 GENE.c45357_g1_i1~~c45357_g1_i1.p1  ORF type:complete len:159 (-),score=23.32 c45357_g1_i1:31-507(-)
MGTINQAMVRVLVFVCLMACAASAPFDLFDGILMQSQSQSELQNPADPAKRASCLSRRGFSECREIESDCELVTVNGEQKVSFPALQVDIAFPCDEEFHRLPMVMTTVWGPDNSKLYQASLRHANKTAFSVNIQRVDDVVDPVMTCDPIKLCYIALAV